MIDRRAVLLAAGLMATITFPAVAQKTTLPAGAIRYMETASGQLSPPFVNGFLTFPTPRGYRYTVQQIAVMCNTPSATDTLVTGYLNTFKIISSTAVQGFSAPLVAFEKRGPAPFGGWVWTASAPVIAYSDYSPFSADGGTGIVINVFHTDTTVSVSCSGTIYGYAEAAP